MIEWVVRQYRSAINWSHGIISTCSYEHLIRPHYLIWSPNASEKLEFDSFPHWAKRNNQVQHICLDMGGEGEELMKITRCDKNGKDPIKYESWKVEKVGKKATLD